MIGNNIDIVLIPPSTERVIKLRLPISSIFFISALVISFTLYSTFVFARYFESISRYEEFKDIQKNINFQKLILKKLDNTLSDYSNKITELKDFDKKIRIITGQEDTIASSRNNQIQSIENLEKLSLINSSKLSQDEVVINNRFLPLNLNVQNLRNGMFLLESIVQENKDKLSRTPSIIPLKAGHLTSRYGIRNDPFTGNPRMHYGIDWAYLPYTPVYSPANGVVKDVVKSFSYGNLLIINHGYGIVTRYAHLAKIEVIKGDKIKRGQLIARMGGTGARSTAVHLHYEVMVGNKFANPENFLIDGPIIRN